jgi:hypothetical protein
MAFASRLPLAVLLAVLALCLAACGGDDEDSTTGGAAQRTDSVATGRTSDDTTDATAPDDSAGGDDSPSGGLEAPPKGSEEGGEGGAGDEVPASSQALIEGRDGAFHPEVVHVPPFIAIRVELRSVDGVEYELGAMGKKVEAGGEIERASTLFPGLRAGEQLVLEGPHGKVVIRADAEPGP